MLRATLDTNVIVSGVISRRAAPFELLAAWLRGEFVLITSSTIIEEVVEVLARDHLRRKYHLTDERIALVREQLQAEAYVVTPTFPVLAVSADPDDDHVLACAVAGDADYLVSGDRHLLTLGSYEGITIVTVREFLDLLTAIRP